MNLKFLSALTLTGAALLAWQGLASANPFKPSNQWHWSSPIQNGKIEYNNVKNITVPMDELTPAARQFISNCNVEVRMRGFIDRQGEYQWDKAELLCRAPKQARTGGSEMPISYRETGRDLYVFGHNASVPQCSTYSTFQGPRNWTNCGFIVPNNTTAKVLVGQGTNAGQVLTTHQTGSGVDTVVPILLQSLRERREELWQKMLRDRQN